MGGFQFVLESMLVVDINGVTDCGQIGEILVVIHRPRGPNPAPVIVMTSRPKLRGEFLPCHGLPDVGQIALTVIGVDQRQEAIWFRDDLLGVHVAEGNIQATGKLGETQVTTRLVHLHAPDRTGQAFGDFYQSALVLIGLGCGAFLLGDVHEYAIQPDNLTGAIALGEAMFHHPSRLAVAMPDAVLQQPGAIGLCRSTDVLLQSGGILFQNQLAKTDGPIVDELVSGISGQRLHPG